MGVGKNAKNVTLTRYKDELVEQESVSQSMSRMAAEENKAWVNEEEHASGLRCDREREILSLTGYETESKVLA